MLQYAVKKFGVWMAVSFAVVLLVLRKFMPHILLFVAVCGFDKFHLVHYLVSLLCGMVLQNKTEPFSQRPGQFSKELRHACSNQN